jgi:hypothetical protein
MLMVTFTTRSHLSTKKSAQINIGNEAERSPVAVMRNLTQVFKLTELLRKLGSEDCGGGEQNWFKVVHNREVHYYMCCIRLHYKTICFVDTSTTLISSTFCP